MSIIQQCPNCGNYVEGKRIQSYSKKVAKTGVKRVANGFTSVSGAGVGAAIGSIIPGVGTVIGAAIGFLGSTIFHSAVNDGVDAVADFVTDADYEFTCPKCRHRWKRDAKKIDNDLEKIARIIAETLHIDVQGDSLILSLEELGADDSDVIEICTKLESEFGIDIPDGTIEKSSYIFEIFEYITGERFWDEDFIDDLRESFEDDEEMTPRQRKFLDHIRQSYDIS